MALPTELKVVASAMIIATKLLLAALSNEERQRNKMTMATVIVVLFSRFQKQVNFRTERNSLLLSRYLFRIPRRMVRIQAKSDFWTCRSTPFVLLLVPWSQHLSGAAEQE
jgi:hypothetical protein